MQGILRGRLSSGFCRNRWTPSFSVPRIYHGYVHRYNSSTTTSPGVTPIEKLILDNIKAVGPMPFATYMQFCLGHPIEGYYMNQRNQVIGPKGDFVTSPEISQLFGELIAIWLFSQWRTAGAPRDVRLVELGPGKGTLMKDILLTFNQLFRKLNVTPNIEVHLLENSMALRDVQREKLGSSGLQLQWHDTVDSIPKSLTQYTMLVAHEFFDALPVHVLRKTAEGWKEIMVTTDDTISQKSNEGGSIASDANTHADISPKTQTPPESPSSHPHPTLRLALNPSTTAASAIFGSSSPRFKDLSVNSDLEVSPTAFRIARKVGELLSRKEGESFGGCGLIIDYGAARAFGESKRAFKDHKVVHYFHRPGECDITANVDFAYLMEAMQDLVPTYPPLTQSQFLTQMGLLERLRFFAEQTSAESVTGDEATKAEADALWERISEGAKRLIDPERMGSQYMVLGMSSGSGSEKGGYVYPFGESVSVGKGEGQSESSNP